MKKTFALSLIALAAIGCTKQTAVENPTEEPALVPMTFTAQIEDTKAMLDGVKTTWIAGDQISVAKLTLNTKVTDAPVLTASKSGASTTFTGEAPEGFETYYAFYPASAVTSWNPSANKNVTAVATKIQPTQTVQCIGTTSAGKNVYIDPSVMFMAATAGSDLNFEFRHVGAYIKFEIPESETLKVLTVTFNDAATDTGTGQTSIAGVCNFTGATDWSFGLSGTGKAIALRYQEDSKTVKLPAGIYYMAVRPSKELKCARFNFLNTAGSKHAYFCKDNAVTFNQGTVYNIGVIPENIFDD